MKLLDTTCSDLLLLFPDPFPITREEIALAHALLTRYPTLLPRDAIHAAVVQANHLEGVVSADKVFDAVDNLRRFDPLELYPEGVTGGDVGRQTGSSRQN